MPRQRWSDERSAAGPPWARDALRRGPVAGSGATGRRKGAGRRGHRRWIEPHAARELIGISGLVDLLVIGSRAYGPLRAVLLGGVSGKVIRSASCPVIVIPNGAQSGIGSVFTKATHRA
ncbi:MAG: universal stress protein [Solirubrobacteraceae bacterium]